VSKPILLDALQRALAAGEAEPKPPAHAAQAAGEADLIDDAYLAGHQDMLGAARLGALRQVFAETAAGLSQAIAEAARRGDRAGYRRAVHQLGSAASALGLGVLFARCTVLEASAAAMPADELLAAAQELETLRRTSLAALDERLCTPVM
jgi:HPt (histidine-containing phosphotransfer) domain-containing protein